MRIVVCSRGVACQQELCVGHELQLRAHRPISDCFLWAVTTCAECCVHSRMLYCSTADQYRPPHTCMLGSRILWLDNQLTYSSADPTYVCQQFTRAPKNSYHMHNSQAV